MTELYPWFVFAHLAGLVLFAICHGASAFMAFRLRAAPDARTAAGPAQGGRVVGRTDVHRLLLLIVGGLGAAAGATCGAGRGSSPRSRLRRVLVVMWAVASPYYMGLRKALQDKRAGRRTVDDLGRPPSPLDSRRPEILVAVGTVGLLLLVWLMVIKPGG